MRKAQLCNVQYADYVADPIRTVERMYQHFGIELSTDARRAMQAHRDQHRREDRPAHRYDTGDERLREEERALFARYQAYFAVSSEF